MGLVDQMEFDERVSSSQLGSIAAFDKEERGNREFWDDVPGKKLDSIRTLTVKFHRIILWSNYLRKLREP